jgi:Xaa-Pro aminopeptidase
VDQNGIYAERLERVQAEMRRRGVDRLFVTPSSDMIYLLGYPAEPSERLTLLGIPRAGRPFAVAPRLDAMLLDERRELLDVHAWDETESPFELVARLSEGSDGQTIAISDHSYAIFLLRLQAVMPEARFQSANPVLRELRMIKDDQEVAALREAAERTDAAWKRFVETVKLAGRTEREIGAELSRLLLEAGMESVAFMIVASGSNSAMPHHEAGHRVVQAGDAIVFDFGARWAHYNSDMTRTVHVGQPSDAFREVYDIVLQANIAAFEAVLPGVACEDIDTAAREIISAAGYGDYFIHRVGHGLGLDVHEEPYFVHGNELPLQPGMVFSDEPGVYLPGRFGVRTEDTLLCTVDGAERLNRTPHQLVVME